MKNFLQANEIDKRYQFTKHKNFQKFSQEDLEFFIFIGQANTNHKPTKNNTFVPLFCHLLDLWLEALTERCRKPFFYPSLPTSRLLR